MISSACRRLLRSLRCFGNGNLRNGISSSLRCSSSSTRLWSTPLAKNIAEAIAVSQSAALPNHALILIQATGPISIASYMRQCLTSPDGGYYTSRIKGRDQFGQKGDFITSPEISQVFGELLGIWMVAEWMSQGKISHGVEMIEVGPGRGTLMDDMLRVWYGALIEPLQHRVDGTCRPSATSNRWRRVLNRFIWLRQAPHYGKPKESSFAEMPPSRRLRLAFEAKVNTPVSL